MTIKSMLAACLCALSFALAAPRAEAASAAALEAQARGTMDRFFDTVGGARDLASKAQAILVFPSVVKAGLGIGGEYGEGVLYERGAANGYYNVVSASVGFQLGVQSRSVIIMFMTSEALRSFRKAAGFKVGVDGSVAIITVGVGGSIDTARITQPVIGFVLDPKGLMYNLTLEGSKISRIKK